MNSGRANISSAFSSNVAMLLKMLASARSTVKAAMGVSSRPVPCMATAGPRAVPKIPKFGGSLGPACGASDGKAKLENSSSPAPVPKPFGVTQPKATWPEIAAASKEENNMVQSD